MATRVEHDFLGEMSIPDDVYYGIQTYRAVENFYFTHTKIYHFQEFIHAFAYIKKAAVLANNELGLVSDEIKNAICQACDDLLAGKFHDQFPTDCIQGGAGTSVNMNANEVIANRALEIMGHKKGDYQHCHPNDHVNCSQSTNDAYPSSLHLAIYAMMHRLIDGVKYLQKGFEEKGIEFKDIVKMGRTQLQDAVPMTLGMEFTAYAHTLEPEIRRLERVSKELLEVNMGATAIGTGICSPKGYAPLVIKKLKEVTGLDITLSDDLIEATWDTGPLVQASSAIKNLAVKLSKISNDLRLLSSGPRCGLNEINLPQLQPGSSIMPGKVNPVIPEAVNQVCFEVMGKDLTVTLASEAGQLELNVMEPVIAFALFTGINSLRRACHTLQDKCVKGITANPDVCRAQVENSIGIVTALKPHIGYEASASVAREALEKNESVYKLILERNLLTKERLDEILSPENMLTPA